jgi:hypothetical protein
MGRIVKTQVNITGYTAKPFLLLHFRVVSDLVQVSVR